MDLSCLPNSVIYRIERLRNMVQNPDNPEELPGVRIYINDVKTMKQNGPQCGLVALQMAALQLKQPEVDITEILTIAKKAGYTEQGEMYSTTWLANLTEKVFPELEAADISFPTNGEMSSYLLAGKALLVPYDCEKNFEPINLNGYKAHWAIIIGFLYLSLKCTDIEHIKEPLTEEQVDDLEYVYVLAKQGKAQNMTLWSLDDLRSSNAQLNEVGPDRSYESYRIPENGPQLKGRCVLIFQK